MEVRSTDFDDLFLIDLDVFSDERGHFIKTIHAPTFETGNLDCDFKESYYSISKKDVFRGMHFQSVPYEHSKLVHVVHGAILDIVLDLRSNSKRFGEYFTIEMTSKNRKALYVGKGFAHGFLSLENDTIVEYHTTSVQSKIGEGGVRWDSFGFKLPISVPIISLRDGALPVFDKNLNYF